ncbi:hypothetical protein PP175_28060 (plasmid) [Aneurinibacillus sp. Ricciae_BoGa-3]|uniref:hypothetical protein n=1 Tax=Aneurinibacillus sp. Ricciae_BoGa-3 TaxID=3022697 RepID=UPI00234239B7|nr:hypothetical protein [Aneurinibacillus sp. Ricciae_BoGa-3]WCK57047.1 hypothetical protein PP175_28060 [Aneurinibacillus sp. Ricciae_BoGa-3]
MKRITAYLVSIGALMALLSGCSQTHYHAYTPPVQHVIVHHSPVVTHHVVTQHVVTTHIVSNHVRSTHPLLVKEHGGSHHAVTTHTVTTHVTTNHHY